MKKKIEVEKEFLDMILRKITDLEKRLTQEPTQIILPTSITENYIYQCSAISPMQINEEDKIEFQKKVDDFGIELKSLMKKYNFIKTIAEFSAKNIN